MPPRRRVNERVKGMRISTVCVLQESKRIAQDDNIKEFKAYPSWVFRFMKRNNLSVRFSTSVGQKLPSDWEAKEVKFRLYLRENLFGVDSCQFWNMHEIPVSFDMPSSRTVNLKGAKEVDSDSDYVHDDTFSEMEAEEIPKEILNAIDSFNVESDKEFLGFEWCYV
jgi:hypothetical protein